MEETVQVLAEDYINNPTDCNFKRLYSKLNKRLRFFIWKYVKYQKDPNDVVDEIMQRTFTQFFYNISKYNGTTSFITWIYTIAKNEAYNYIKKANKTISLEEEFVNIHKDHSKYKNEDDIQDYGLVFNEDFICDIEIETDKKYEKQKEAKQKSNIIFEVMNELQIEYKIVLVDRFINNLSYVDIAVKNNINLNTVRTRIRKGKEILRTKLKF